MIHYSQCKIEIFTECKLAVKKRFHTTAQDVTPYKMRYRDGGKYMTEKPKRKNDEPGFWDKLLDVVLLAKAFEWVVDCSLHECMECLRDLSEYRTGFASIMRQDVKVTQVNNASACDFVITRVRNERRSFTSAKATGVIVLDKGTEKTIIRGKIRIGKDIIRLPVLLLAIEFIVYLLLPFPNNAKALLLDAFLAVFSFGVLFYMTTGIVDRNRLYNLIPDSFPIENKSKKKNIAL